MTTDKLRAALEALRLVTVSTEWSCMEIDTQDAVMAAIEALASPSQPEGVRERIARVIDPVIWESPANTKPIYDSKNRLIGQKLIDPPILSPEHGIGASLAKADKIIAIFTGTEEEGT